LTLTIDILGPAAESPHALQLRDGLLRSAPKLREEGIRLAIIPQVYANRTEIDCVLVFEDSRHEAELFRTVENIPIRSFVTCLEFRPQGRDDVRLQDKRLEVWQGGAWCEVSAGARAQVWALQDLQEQAFRGNRRRGRTTVHAGSWFQRVPLGVVPDPLGVVLWAEPDWQRLTARLMVNQKMGAVQTLVASGEDSKHHSFKSLVETLTARVEPTQLDLQRVDALTRKRFDADKQRYVDRLGTGLLMFRGRAGTGKTFALIQMAIHLARQGKRTRIVTYQHGLISDMTRALNIIRDRHPDISPLPHIETRWMLMEELFTLAFGTVACERARELYEDLAEREWLFLRALGHPADFLRETMPCCAYVVAGKRCFCEPSSVDWGAIASYSVKFPAPYDFLLIDEGQDWNNDQRDLMYRIFSAQNVIVADGVDQFVTLDRCNWDRGDMVKNAIVTLRTSRRTKAATCETISEIARALKVPDWNVEPDVSLRGGRITVLVEPDPARAIERTLKILGQDLKVQPKMAPVDALVCLPHKGATPGAVYQNLFDRICNAKDEDFWSGYDWQTRKHRDYPSRNSQLRVVLYESSRGMEGWTTLCLGLDQYFDHLVAKPDIDLSRLRESVRSELGFLDAAALIADRIALEKRHFALQRLMIPLTRSMDHLVIHLNEAQSALGRVLQGIGKGRIEWV
jgi:hypothetical protein